MASEDLKQLTYDFDLICRSLSLIPWREGAFNAGAIVSIRFDENKNAVVELYNGHAITLSPADLAELETWIKRRIAEIATAAQIQQPGMIVGAPTGRKFRQ